MASSAGAQSAEDAAAAEALYDEGTRLMDAGDYDGACPKLAESHRLDPALGALLALAACRERAGHLASAWVTYLDVLAQAKAAGDGERAAAAKDRSDALAPRLPRMRIELAPAVATLPGLVVLRDGQAVDPAVASTSVPVDPGEHVVTVRATGHVPLERRISAAEGRSDTVTIDRLEPHAPEPAAGADTAGAPTSPPDDPGDGGLTGLQIGGLVIGGVGVAALGVGLAFGGVAMSAQGELDDAGYDPDGGPCTGPGVTPAECTALYDDASSAATLSTVFTIAGGALAATGLVLVLVGGDDGEPSGTGVVVAPTLAGLTVRGAL